MRPIHYDNGELEYRFFTEYNGNIGDKGMLEGRWHLKKKVHSKNHKATSIEIAKYLSDDGKPIKTITIKIT